MVVVQMDGRRAYELMLEDIRTSCPQLRPPLKLMDEWRAFMNRWQHQQLPTIANDLLFYHAMAPDTVRRWWPVAYREYVWQSIEAEVGTFVQSAVGVH
jgi:hypothetical protein